MSLSNFDSDDDPEQEYGFQSLSVEYAKSGRAACKGCFKAIPIRELRYVIRGQSWEHYEYTKFCHVQCLEKVTDIKKCHNRLHILDNVLGMPSIIRKDQNDVQKQIRRLKIKLEKEIKKKQQKQQQKARPKRTKKLVVFSDPEDSDFSSDSSSSESESEEEEESKNDQIEIRDDSDLSAEMDQNPNPRKRKAVAPLRQKKVPQKKLKVAQKKGYDNLTVAELKNLLEMNNQTTFWEDKNELLKFANNGKQYGQLPQCYQCGAGQLLYNPLSLQYECQGYQDYQKNIVKCGFVYQQTEIKKQPWIDI